MVQQEENRIILSKITEKPIHYIAIILFISIPTLMMITSNELTTKMKVALVFLAIIIILSVTFIPFRKITKGIAGILFVGILSAITGTYIYKTTLIDIAHIVAPLALFTYLVSSIVQEVCFNKKLYVIINILVSSVGLLFVYLVAMTTKSSIPPLYLFVNCAILSVEFFVLLLMKEPQENKK